MGIDQLTKVRARSHCLLTSKPSPTVSSVKRWANSESGGSSNHFVVDAVLYAGKRALR